MSVRALPQPPSVADQQYPSGKTSCFPVKVCMSLCFGVFVVLQAVASKPTPALEAVYLVLETEPVVRISEGTGSEPAPNPAVAQARRAGIVQVQRELIPQIEALGGRIQRQYHTLANVIKVQVPRRQASSLSRLPGVKALRPVRHFERHTASSVPFIGAPEVWKRAPLPATGKGLRVGIIDSGIDYLHAHFGGSGSVTDFQQNDPTIVEPGTFPTHKVAGGWDFVGRDYDSSIPGQDIPEPDPDPLDCAADGHGSHVAGIAAGLGVLTNGSTYTGSYQTLPPWSAFRVGPGVAPEATLYALKVFGCSGTTGVVLDALEWAADPNGDGNFEDRLDVVNLSLGSPFGLEGDDDPEEAAVNRLVALGTVVVISAGNSGNTFYIVGGPGTAVGAITVANSIDNTHETSALTILSPSAIAGLYPMEEGSFTKQLALTGSVEGEVVYVQPGDACSELLNPAQLTGSIALMDRGTCYFVDKVQRAQEAGAKAVIVVNNVPGAPIVMGGTPEYEVLIPGVMISQSDGAVLKTNLNHRPRVRLEAGLTISSKSYTDQLSASTSRGPALPAHHLKPDVAAPGHNIVSAKAGSGNQGNTMTGTSMAAPHVAGAAALLRQLHPDWSVEDIKATLMGTALSTRSETGECYPESLTGAGRIALASAAKTLVTARADESVSLNLGSLTLWEDYSAVRNIILRNHGEESVTFTLAVSNNVSENGFLVSPLTDRVAVPAGSSLMVPVRITATPGLFDRTPDRITPMQIRNEPRFLPFEVSGQIYFLHPEQSLHVPFYGIARASSEWRSSIDALVLPKSELAQTVELPVSGPSAHPEAFLSVYQLGLTSEISPDLPMASRAADVVAAGAASDALNHSGVENATIYFGVVTAEPMATPAGFHAQVAVEIDTDFDEWPDYTLYNSSLGNFEAEDLSDADSADDVFKAVLVDESTGLPMAHEFINFFSPQDRDTAAFGSRVFVLPVKAKGLSLNASSSAFQYRITTTGAYARYSPSVDRTEWAQFDAAKPYVDSTPFGLQKTPFFLNPTAAKVVVNEVAAAENGVTDEATAGVLLLYHFNPGETAFGIVSLIRDPYEAAPLVLLPPQITTTGSVQLRWTSSIGQTYRVRATSNLSSGFTEVVAQDIPGTPPYNTFTDPIAPSGTRFYRIEQQ